MILIVCLFFLGWIIFFMWKLEKKPVRIPSVNLSKISNFSKNSKVYQDFVEKFRHTRAIKDYSAEMVNWASEAALSKKTHLYKKLPELAEGFTEWIKNLPPQELLDFSAHAAVFCNSLNVELKWLFDPGTPAELKQAVEESLLLYCLAYTRMQGSNPFIQYKIWLDTPDKEKDDNFTQLLYTRLVNEGLASAPADVMLAGEKQRKLYVLQSIGLAYEQNHKTFTAILKDLVMPSVDQPVDLDAPTQPVQKSVADSPVNNSPDGTGN